MNRILLKIWIFGSIAIMGVLSNTQDSYAGAADINKISENIILSITGWPTFVAALSYLCGLTMGVLGIFKVRTHVERPESVPLSQGLIRLFLGGAFLSLPMFYEVITTSIDGDGAVPSVTGPQLATQGFKS